MAAKKRVTPKAPKATSKKTGGRKAAATRVSKMKSAMKSAIKVT